MEIHWSKLRCPTPPSIVMVALCSFLKHHLYCTWREPCGSCCRSNTHQQSTRHYVKHRRALMHVSNGSGCRWDHINWHARLKNRLVSWSKVNVTIINDSWSVRSMSSVFLWRREGWDCACLYGRMRERSAEGKGSVTSGNRIYRYGKQISFLRVHVEMNQCMFGERQRGQSGWQYWKMASWHHATIEEET